MTGEHPVRLESIEVGKDGRQYSPSAGRNRHHIVNALVELLPPHGVCLEVASGTGEHAVLAARHLKHWHWITSDRDEGALTSIKAWVKHAGLPNLEQPRRFDLNNPWPFDQDSLDAVFASNLMHITPIETTKALFRGAARHLKSGCSLFIYGPVFLSDVPRPEGNRLFDEELRLRDPRLGVRDLSELVEIAERTGLGLALVRSMPACNTIVKLEKP